MIEKTISKRFQATIDLSNILSDTENINLNTNGNPLDHVEEWKNIILEGKKYYIYKKNYYGVIILTSLINILFKTNISDAAAAIKFFRKEIFDRLTVKTNAFDFEFDHCHW